jgi:Arc/MetJ-type ribon-helix-helix transcriptional regulator
MRPAPRRSCNGARSSGWAACIVHRPLVLGPVSPQHVRADRDNVTIKPERGTSRACVVSPLERDIMVSPMAHRSVTVRKKKRRPPAAAKGTLIGLRLEPGVLARVDRWAASQQDDPSRSEAIRRLVELGLASTQRAGARTKRAAKAAEMASEEIDRLGDLAATDEERRLRKRRLIRGPKEFQDLRRNRPKANE